MDHLSFAHEVLTVRSSMDTIALAVGLVFGFAAVSKLSDFASFIAGIRSYEAIPDRLTPLVARLLITGESLVALAHFTGVGLRFASLLAIVMLSIFLLTTANVLKRGDKRPCLCFGADSTEMAGISSLARVSILWLAEVSVYLYLSTNEVPMTATSTARSTGSLLIAALIVTLTSWCLNIQKFRRALSVAGS